MFGTIKRIDNNDVIIENTKYIQIKLIVLLVELIEYLIY